MYPTISVIMPIYNAACYLNQSIESILHQSLSSFEVILVNDGSTDDSYDICNYYASKDNRIKVINQKNQGVALARQSGMRVAKGEFIIHVDADDYMMNNSLESLYKSIIKDSADIIVGAYIEQTPLGDKTVLHNFKDRQDFLKNMLLGQYRGALWNKLIRADACRNIEFTPGVNYMEDVLFLAKVLQEDKVKVSFTNEIVYYYRMVGTSYTNNLTEKSIRSSVAVIDYLSNMFASEFSVELIHHIKNKCRVKVLLNSKNTARDIFPESNYYVLRDSRLASKYKVVILLDFLKMNILINYYKKLRSIFTRKL